MKTQFIKRITPIQQKGRRRVPTHLNERVEKKLNKSIGQKHNIKLDKLSDKQFISSFVITVIKGSNSKTSIGRQKTCSHN